MLFLSKRGMNSSKIRFLGGWKEFALCVCAVYTVGHNQNLVR